MMAMKGSAPSRSSANVSSTSGQRVAPVRASSSSPPSSSRPSVVAPKVPLLDRRGALISGVVGMASFAATVAAPLPARAILEYDDEDEELKKKMMKTRREAVVREKSAEKDFLKEEGLATSGLKKEISVVQNTVNTLSRAGSLLEEGDRSAVADLLGDANWVGRFKDAAQRVSTGADLDAAYKGLGDLSSAARSGGDVKAIKSTYVVAVSALERWARSAGVNKAVSGL